MRAIFFVFVVLSCLVGLTPRGLEAEIYRWLDRDGQVHFADEYSLVPPEYRDRVQAHPSAPASETPGPLSAQTQPKKAKRAKASPPRLLASGGQAKVQAVLDGDTIIISGGEKVRYAGVNTPESRHPDKLPEYCGEQALEANRRLVAGKTVRLEFEERRRDKYGRLLAYVYADGLFVNAELIRQGYAQVSTYRENQRYHEEFERLQLNAIAMRRGLWGGCADIHMPPAQPKPKAQRRMR
ncbi:MAG TPA: thermonuclease family protein [Candidatus Tectomicrobia bacterium]|nr:thermonuclease family protein [Candidatus Tectomicrobia bacterium]